MSTLRPNGAVNRENMKHERQLYVVLFAKNPDTLETIQSAVAESMPDAKIEMYGTVGTFGEGLRKLAYDCTITVIVASGKDELREISSLQEFLWGLRTIVVIPDGDDEMISLAHGLRPRFVSSYGDGFVKVIAVLSKMLEDHNLKSSAG